MHPCTSASSCVPCTLCTHAPCEPGTSTPAAAGSAPERQPEERRRAAVGQQHLSQGCRGALAHGRGRGQGHVKHNQQREQHTRGREHRVAAGPPPAAAQPGRHGGGHHEQRSCNEGGWAGRGGAFVGSHCCLWPPCELRNRPRQGPPTQPSCCKPRPLCPSSRPGPTCQRHQGGGGAAVERHPGHRQAALQGVHRAHDGIVAQPEGRHPAPAP